MPSPEDHQKFPGTFSVGFFLAALFESSGLKRLAGQPGVKLSPLSLLGLIGGDIWSLELCHRNSQRLQGYGTKKNPFLSKSFSRYQMGKLYCVRINEWVEQAAECLGLVPGPLLRWDGMGFWILCPRDILGTFANAPLLLGQVLLLCPKPFLSSW